MKIGLNFGAFIDGLSVFLIGVSMVFMVLLLLIFLIKCVGWVVGTIENKHFIKSELEMPSTPVKENEYKQEDLMVKENDLEIIAVITATIAASLGTTTDQLQVRSLRQVNRKRV